MDTVIKFAQMICWLGGAAMVLFFACAVLTEFWYALRKNRMLYKFRKAGEEAKRGNDK